MKVNGSSQNPVGDTQKYFESLQAVSQILESAADAEADWLEQVKEKLSKIKNGDLDKSKGLGG